MNSASTLPVAPAGRPVNMAIALALVAVFGPDLRQAVDLDTTTPYQRRQLVNLMLVTLSLIPALPIDGGRVLRAVQAGRGDLPRPCPMRWSA